MCEVCALCARVRADCPLARTQNFFTSFFISILVFLFFPSGFYFVVSYACVCSLCMRALCSRACACVYVRDVCDLCACVRADCPRVRVHFSLIY